MFPFLSSVPYERAAAKITSPKLCDSWLLAGGASKIEFSFEQQLALGKKHTGKSACATSAVLG
jgi:hypothetical protein